MIVLRFMSAKEALLLARGDTLYNDKQHGKQGRSHTDSEGFCFMEVTKGKGMYERAKVLSGIADMDVCLVGEIDPDFLTASKGRYRDADKEKDPEEMTMGDAMEMMLSTLQMMSGDKEEQENQSVWLPEFYTLTYGLHDFKHWGFYEPERKDNDGGHGKLPNMVSSSDWKKPTLIMKGGE